MLYSFPFGIDDFGRPSAGKLVGEPIDSMAEEKRFDVRFGTPPGFPGQPVRHSQELERSVSEGAVFMLCENQNFACHL